MTFEEKISRAAENKVGCILTNKGVVIAYERGQCRVMSFNKERFHDNGSRLVLPYDATVDDIKAAIERLTGNM